jgi:capsid portal protein
MAEITTIDNKPEGEKKFYRFDKIFDPAVPSLIEVRGPYNNAWVAYGQDNLYPQFIIEMWNKSAILRTGLLAKITAVKGNGLESEDLNDADGLEEANPEESWNDIWAKVVQDYEIFGGYCLNVIWSNDGSQIAAIYHVDFSKVRSGILDRETDRVEYYWVSSDWSRYKKAEWKPKAYHKYDPALALEYPSQLLYYFDHNPGQIYYGLPTWISGGTDVMSDIEISSYHVSHLKQGLTPSMIINMNNGDPGPMERQAIFEEIASSFSGTENAGKFFLSFNQSKDTETNIQTIQPVGDDYYLNLEQRISSRVLSALRITNPKICGLYLDTPGGLKNTTKDEMIVDYELFKQQVVIPDTKTLLKPMNKLWEKMGKRGKLQVIPISLFPNQEGDPTSAPELVDNKINEPQPVQPLA